VRPDAAETGCRLLGGAGFKLADVSTRPVLSGCQPFPDSLQSRRDPCCTAELSADHRAECCVLSVSVCRCRLADRPAPDRQRTGTRMDDGLLADGHLVAV